MNRLVKIRYFCLFVFLFLFMALPLSVFSFKKANEGRILFNVIFLGENLRGKTKDEVYNIYLQKIDSYRLTFIFDSLSKEYSLIDFGINLDYSKIEKEIYSHNEISLFNFYKKPAFYLGKQKISYKLVLPLSNLKVEDKGQFVFSSKGGEFHFFNEIPREINRDRFIDFIIDDLGFSNLEVAGWDSDSAHFTELQKLLKNDIEITLGGQKVLLGSSDKVKFIDFKDNDISINKEKLSIFFENELLVRLNIPAKNRIVRVENKEREIEVFAGEKGFSVDADFLLEALVEAIKNNEKEIVAKGEFVEPLTQYEHVIIPDWSKKVVVNLSTQTLIAYEGEEEVFKDRISSGKSSTPTPLGTYFVYGKTSIQGMRGPNYYLPNVRWITWFYGDYAIHATYWHNNFGTPMSRGCINMTNQSAEFIYNWINIGNPVLVIY
jgi:hypothetical protein